MNVPLLLIVGSITVAGAALLAFFLKGSGNSYGRAFFWSLLMLIGLMALIMKIFNSNY